MMTETQPTIQILPAAPDQLETAAAIYQAAARDLHDRLRAQNPWSSLPARSEDFDQAVRTLQGLQHGRDRSVLLAIDERGAAVGMAAVMIQPPHAHLAFFFVVPERQNQGIGRRLLEAVREIADAAGTTTMTLASSRDPKAWHRYLRFGLRPGLPMLPYRATHPIFPLAVPDHPHLTHRPLEIRDLDQVAALDWEVRGADRRDRLAEWLSTSAGGGLVFDRATGRPVGYAMVSIDTWCGQVGPVVALRTGDFPYALTVALAAAGRIPNPDQLPWRADASARNTLAVEPLLAAGFAVENLVSWFETGPVGHWDRYVFRNEDQL